jgi:hypothetical protein
MNSEPPSGADVDNYCSEGDYRRMEDRIIMLEHTLAALQADVGVIRSNYATREDVTHVGVDLLKEMNGQTWRIISWVTTTATLLTAAVYFIARHVD